MTAADLCEMLGSILVIVGSITIAMHNRASKYGWVAFLLSNFCFIGLSVLINRPWMLLAQIVLANTSLLGLYKVGLWPQWLRLDFFKKKESRT